MTPLFYIHKTACISPQQTFSEVAIDTPVAPEGGKLAVLEASYPGIPPAMLRRMSKAVRMGMGVALKVMSEQAAPDGIIIGTS